MNESKTEFVLFAPSDSATVVPVDLGCLTQDMPLWLQTWESSWTVI